MSFSPRLTGVVIAAFASLACAETGGGGAPAPGRPATLPSEVPPVAAAAPAASATAAEPGRQFSPSGPAAERYGDDPSRPGPRLDALRTGLLVDIERAARAAGAPAPRADHRLHAVADDLARELRGEELPSPELVDFLLSHYGIVEPSPHLVLARTTTGGETALREGLAAQIRAVLKAGEPMRAGVGVMREGEDVRVVLALQERRLELEPVPRRLAARAAVPLSGRLLGALREPHVEVTGPDGSVAEVETTMRAGRFHARLSCSRGDGRYQVEIGGSDRFGASVLANFPVYCGRDAPPSIAHSAAAPSAPIRAPAEAEQAMLQLVNRDRAAAKLPPLQWDERLAAVARAHSRDMSEHDFVGHVSPTTGNALDRVQRAGISPTLLMENVGRAYSVDELERGLMASPAHRGNLLSPRARRVGIGIATGRQEGGLVPLYATQLFM